MRSDFASGAVIVETPEGAEIVIAVNVDAVARLRLTGKSQLPKKISRRKGCVLLAGADGKTTNAKNKIPAARSARGRRMV